MPSFCFITVKFMLSRRGQDLKYYNYKINGNLQKILFNTLAN